MIKFTAEQQAAFEEGEMDDCSLMYFSPEGWLDPDKTPEDKETMSKRAFVLRDGMKMPYEKKLAYTKKIIKKSYELYPDDKWAVSYSGGKDSTVLSDIIIKLGYKPDHVFSNTRMEYTETIAAVSKMYKKLRAEGIACHTALPKIRPKELWEKFGVPLFSKELAQVFNVYKKSGMKSKKVQNRMPKGMRPIFDRLIAKDIKINDKCCRELKEKPIKKLCKEQGITANFVGIRCDESRLRQTNFITFGHIYYGKTRGRVTSNPLSLWLEEDIFRYIRENDIELEKIKGSATGRSGCKTCMFGCHLNKNNNLKQLAKTNPKMWEIALDEWGYREALEVAGVGYDPDPEQQNLFEMEDYGKLGKLG